MIWRWIERKVAQGALGRLALVCGLLTGLAAGQGAGQGAQAGEIVGRPKVVDGDTLDFSGRIVRLYGIDAPELDQTCRADDQLWPCGKEASWAAANRIHPHWVTCVPKGHAPDGAELAVCYLAGIGQQELNVWLVAKGWALAGPARNGAYAEAERAAKAARKGLWRGSFIAPWDWRQGKRLAP